jgi:hypothetical protein
VQALDRIPWDGLGPEDALLAQEAQKIARASGVRRPPIRELPVSIALTASYRGHQLTELASAFLKPETERLLRAYLLGESAPSIARREGVTRQAVDQRLYAATRLLRWAATLETWATSATVIELDLGPHVSLSELLVLELLWANRFSQRRVQKALGGSFAGHHIVARLRKRLALIQTPAVEPYARDLARAHARETKIDLYDA